MILELDNINKSYGKLDVLKNIQLTIEEPRLIALIAPNGSGKTTLLNIICHLEKVDSGTVYINNELNDSVDIFKSLTYMQDNSILYPNLTGMDHLTYVRKIHHVTKKRLNDYIKHLKMESYVNRKVKHYSLGMKQHLLFLLSVLPKPSILLMDEPLNGLDPASVVRVRQMLIDLHQNGTTIFFSSHNLEQIDKLTTDILFLKDKQLISYEDILLNQPYRTYRVVTGNMELFSKEVRKKVKEFTQETKRICCIVCKADVFEKIVSEKLYRIYDYQVMTTSLEEIYFNLFEGYTYDYRI